MRRSGASARGGESGDEVVMKKEGEKERLEAKKTERENVGTL